MIKNKKSAMGITTLILFIAVTFIAMVVVVAILTNTYTFQQKSTTMRSTATKEITKQVLVKDVYSMYDYNGNLKNFTTTMSLAPGSDAIKLEDVIYIVKTDNETIYLSYKKTTTPKVEGFNGYETLEKEEIGFVNSSIAYNLTQDYELNAYQDSMQLTDNTISFAFSNSNLNFNIDVGFNCSNLSIQNLNTTWTSSSASNPIKEIKLEGICYNGTIPSSTNFLITPRKYAYGYFTVEHLQKTNINFIEDAINYGDIVNLYYETPEKVSTEKSMILRFVTNKGITTETRFMTPNIISKGIVHLLHETN